MPKEETKNNNCGLTAVILGILSILFAGINGLILAILALTFASKQNPQIRRKISQKDKGE